ncbi:MAG TPA: TonB-dependent receptor [Gammaproteobacteria bacterium]|nr:TonB-dependent receptor [Gammaproteobacteria bacterium]
MTQPKAQLAAAVAAALCGLSTVPAVSHAQPASTERPEEIVVTSSLLPTPKRQIGTAVSVIDGPAIELRGYASLADVMRTQPGIGVTNAGGPGKSTSLRIRGEDGYRTLLIIDGIKDVDPSGTQVGPSFDSLLATDDIERVEVLRGPQGFIYGADAGGVVNVITGRGAELGGSASLEAGEFDTRKITASLSGGDDKADFYVSGADLDTDGFNAQVADDVLRDNDGADNTTLHAKLGFKPTEDLRLQLVFRDVDASSKYDNCFTAAFDPSNDCVETTDQQTYRLSAEHNRGDFGNTFAYSNVDVARDNLTEGVSAFATHGTIDRFEYSGSYKPSDMLALVYGADLQRQEVADDTAGSTLSQDQDGYYVEYQGAFKDAFFLTVGARYDDNEDFGTHTSSRVSAAYVQQLAGGNSVKYRASAGNGFRAPSPFEVSYNRRPFGVLPAARATTLREETSGGYDLGVELDTAGGLHFEATYFDQDIEDAIVYTFDLNTFDDGYVQSQGTSTSKGIELGMEAPFGERWRFIGNWTNNDTETTAGQPRVNRPKNLGNFGVQYASMNAAFRFIANYRLSRDALDFSNTPVDDYEVLDLSVAYSLGKTWELFGRVENATDEDYQEVNGFNTAGRAVYGGARLRF